MRYSCQLNATNAQLGLYRGISASVVFLAANMCDWSIIWTVTSSC